jgi:hypothetical protein
MARASRVLPAPGGPIISTLCPPAAATSRARLTCSWPFDLAEVGQHDGGDRRSATGGLGGWGSPVRWAYSSASEAPGSLPARGSGRLRRRRSRGRRCAGSPAGGQGRHRQHAARMAHAAVQRELADHQRPSSRLGRQQPVHDQHPHGDRQVVGGPSLRTEAGARLTTSRLRG